MAAFATAWTNATSSAPADIGSIGPRTSAATTPAAALTANSRTIAPMKNRSRKPNKCHQWPAVSVQLRRMIAIGPAASALATGAGHQHPNGDEDDQGDEQKDDEAAAGSIGMVLESSGTPSADERQANGIASSNSASDDQDRREQIDRHPPEAVRDRRADRDRRPERKPDQRELPGQRRSEAITDQHPVHRGPDASPMPSGSIRPVTAVGKAIRASATRGDQPAVMRQDRLAFLPCRRNRQAAHIIPLVSWSGLMRAHRRARNEACSARRPSAISARRGNSADIEWIESAGAGAL